MENQTDRQSMSRMDDTLIETVLSFLSFTDKIMFECLSKRIKILIYNRVTELRLTRGNERLSSLFSPVRVCDFSTAVANRYEWKTINKYYLKTILLKCKNIEKINLDYYVDLDDLLVVGQLCPYLKNMALQCIGLSANDLKLFGQQYGHKLKQMYFHSQTQNNTYWSQLLRHCPNLTHLWSSDILKLGISEGKEYVPELEETAVEIGDYRLNKRCDDHAYLRQFSMFANKYSSKMKNLDVESYVNLTGDNMDIFAKALVNLGNLQELSLEVQMDQRLDENDTQKLMESIKSMTRLKKLYLVVDVLDFNCDHLMQSMNGFESLTVLNINSGNSLMPYALTKTNVKCLNTLNGLKDFIICFKTISEDFFTDIDQHLPNLRQIIIQCESPITDRTVTELSRLKKLKKLYLSYYKANHKLITDSSVCELITNCPDIQMICFSSRPYITTKSIEALISCANRSPKKVIKFSYGFIDDNDIEIFPVIDITLFAERIPTNLIIEMQ